MAIAPNSPYNPEVTAQNNQQLPAEIPSVGEVPYTDPSQASGEYQQQPQTEYPQQEQYQQEYIQESQVEYQQQPQPEYQAQQVDAQQTYYPQEVQQNVPMQESQVQQEVYQQQYVPQQEVYQQQQYTPEATNLYPQPHQETIPTSELPPLQTQIKQKSHEGENVFVNPEMQGTHFAPTQSSSQQAPGQIPVAKIQAGMSGYPTQLTTNHPLLSLPIIQQQSNGSTDDASTWTGTIVLKIFTVLMRAVGAK
jgi:hypothetical protein